jgi:hypothetical protein
MMEDRMKKKSDTDKSNHYQEYGEHRRRQKRSSRRQKRTSYSDHSTFFLIGLVSRLPIITPPRWTTLGQPFKVVTSERLSGQ